jgi:hypothetical protein
MQAVVGWWATILQRPWSRDHTAGQGHLTESTDPSTPLAFQMSPNQRSIASTITFTIW